MRMLTDSGALMKTFDFPNWYWSPLMWAECIIRRTPSFTSPLHAGHVSSDKMAYLK
jgi:hypothetical protein